MVKLPPLDAIFRHLEAAYPNEGCGVILEGPNGMRVVPLDNVYDKYHRVDPEQFPRTQRTAYLIDPKAWLQLSRESEAKGERVVVIIHSHADVGAYFSAEDKAMAAPNGEPLHPGVEYLVVAVNNARVEAAKLFNFEKGEFKEVFVSVKR